MRLRTMVRWERNGRLGADAGAPGTSMRLGQLLTRALVTLLGVALFAVTFAFSLVIFAILVALALAVFAVALWRARSMRARADRRSPSMSESGPHPPQRFPRR